MTTSQMLTIGAMRQTVGATPALARKAIMARIAAPSWPALDHPAARQHLVERLCEALLADPRKALWSQLLSDTAQPAAVFLAQLVAATAIHLQNVAGHPVSRFSVLATEDGEAPNAVWEILLTRTGEAAGKAAAALLSSVAGPQGKAEDPVAPERVQELVTAVTSAVGNSVVEVILTAAYRRGISFHFVDPLFPMIAFGQGSSTKRLMTSMTHGQGHISTLLTRDKMISLQILREAGFPVPSHHFVASPEAAVAAAALLGYPVVVKPLDLMRSQGVSVNLTSPGAVTEAFKAAQALSRNIIVEQHLPGLPYRILVIGGCARAVMRRSVPMVVGDGSCNIAQLIEHTNLERARMALQNAAAPRRIDITAFESELHACLAEQGLDMQSVPAAGAEIQLAFMARTGRGGENLDVTNLVHPDNLTMAEDAARIFEVDVFGLDFMTDDISRSYKEGNCGINEVNNEPALSLHLAATRSPRDVVTPFFDMAFGPEGNGSIPIICSLADNEGSRFSILERLLKSAGLQSGLAAGKDRAVTGRFHLPATDQFERPAERILADPRVDCALISLTQDDFTRGLAFDRCSAFELPPVPAGGIEDPVVAWSRLMVSELAPTAIVAERDLDFWSANLDLSGLRVILMGDASPSEGDSAGNGFEALTLTSGREIDVVYRHGNHADLLVKLKPEKRRPGALGNQLLLACAALLAMNWYPRDIGRLVAKAFA